MRSFAVAVSALLFATAAHAQDPAGLAPDDSPAASSQAVEAPTARLAAEPASAPDVPAIEPRLAEEQRPAPETAMVADPFARGSFWWYVGIIVAAGVILAVVL